MLPSSCRLKSQMIRKQKRTAKTKFAKELPCQHGWRRLGRVTNKVLLISLQLASLSAEKSDFCFISDELLSFPPDSSRPGWGVVVRTVFVYARSWQLLTSTIKMFSNHLSPLALLILKVIFIWIIPHLRISRLPNFLIQCYLFWTLIQSLKCCF